MLSLAPVSAPAASIESAENAVDHLELSDRRRVVSVDLGRLEVGMAEELLDHPERLACSGELRRECVPEIVESDDAHVRIAARLLEPAADLGSVKRSARLRMAEDEVVLRVEDDAYDAYTPPAVFRFRATSPADLGAAIRTSVPSPPRGACRVRLAGATQRR